MQVIYESVSYLIDPGIYYSGTHLDFSVFAFLHRTFTVLYSHNHNPYATFVKVIVEIRCFKKGRSFICAVSATSVRQEQSSHNAHDISERDNISSRDPHQYDCWKMFHNFTKQFIPRPLRKFRMSRFRNVDLNVYIYRCLFIKLGVGGLEIMFLRGSSMR